MPLCSGVTHVNAGDTTSLACESVYSGYEMPQLQWFRQVHRRHRVFDDQPRQTEGRYGYSVNSFDESEILVARQVSSRRVYKVNCDCFVYTLYEIT